MKTFKLLIMLGILGSLVIVALGYLGHLHPAFDTFAHFRLHLGFALTSIAPILVIRKWLLLGAFTAVMGIAALYSASIGTVFTSKSHAADQTKPVYSLLHFNLYWINKQRSAVIDRILELDPDLISLSEVAERWNIPIKRLDKKWPYLLHCPEWGKRGGVRFYSKWPLDKTSQYCGPFGSFAKTEVISPDGVQFTSGSVHLRWPWPASGPKQLKSILPELGKTGYNALFAGDFNATTWSHTVEQFAEAAQMKIVPGIGSTWMVDELPLRYTWWAGLPIDNVMHKGRIKVLSARTLEDLNSDHLPVLVKFQIN